MKKFISIFLIFAILLAFVSYGNGETPSAEVPPDYSKICVSVNNGRLILKPEDHDELLEDLETGYRHNYKTLIIANVDYLPSDFDGINYTSRSPLSVEFDMLDFSIEEIAQRVETLSAISDVVSITCTYDVGRSQQD